MFTAKMKQSEYACAVSAVLVGFSEEVYSRLVKLGPRIPKRAERAEITIFVDDDGEGLLDISVHLDGPDLYVLNGEIGECSVLFETKMTDEGLAPPLPLMEPDAYEFSVQHTLADCAADWLVGIWKRVDSETFKVPVSIVTRNGFGTKTPIILCM